MINYKYSAKYEIRNNELYIISRESEIILPKLIKVVNGFSDVNTIKVDSEYSIEQIIHNTIKWFLYENIEIPFDYTVHAKYNNDEYLNLLTGELK